MPIGRHKAGQLLPLLTELTILVVKCSGNCSDYRLFPTLMSFDETQELKQVNKLWNRSKQIDEARLP
jgi:hypothetical protein